MKNLFVVRHAKSSWDDHSLPDHKRPLNSRGKRDAPIMAGLMKNRDPEIDLFLTSSAKRAKATAKYFIREYDVPRQELQETSDLYHAGAFQIIAVLSTIQDDVSSLAIFGHNPGFTDFVNQYSDARIDNVPTCGVAHIEFDIDSWSQIAGKSGRLKAFLYPKMAGLF